MPHAVSTITAPDDTDRLSAYWRFHAAVTHAQLTAWLPAGRHLIIDVSGPRGPGAKLAARAGHTVVRITDSPMAAYGARSPAPNADGDGTTGGQARRGRAAARSGAFDRAQAWSSGRIIPVIADCSRLPFLADGCADDVIADDRALSTHLAAEMMVAEIARVLRPSGRVLACVDSLVLGMAVLADQHHWAHLVDLPHAEVVLVPWPDGSITRCYGPDQARDLFSGAGLSVNWIRSRTVLSESTVTHLLRRNPNGLPQLVRAELAAPADDSLGAQLVISARKPRRQASAPNPRTPRAHDR